MEVLSRTSNKLMGKLELEREGEGGGERIKKIRAQSVTMFMTTLYETPKYRDTTATSKLTPNMEIHKPELKLF